MADFKIKPAAGTGNKLILESEDGTDVLTTSDSGVAITAPTIADLSNVTGTLPVGVIGGSGLTALASNPTVTLGSNATFPAGTITGWTRTTTTPTAIQGDATSNTLVTGSSVDYTPTAGSSFVVYEFACYMQGYGIYPLILWNFFKNGSAFGNNNFKTDSRTDGSFAGHAAMEHFRFVMPSWSGAQELKIVYQQWEASSGYRARLHQCTESGDDTSTAVYVDIHRVTYSVM